MILGARRSRAVAGIWALVGLGFLTAGVVLWFDTQRVWFELPAAVLAFILAATFWRQRAELDRHGLRTVYAFRQDRLLWAGIDHVEVRRPRWFRPALVVHPKGERPEIPIPASAGLARRQRDRLLELLTDLSHQHGFDLVTTAAAEPSDARDRRRPGPLSGPPVVPDAGRPDEVAHDEPAAPDRAPARTSAGPAADLPTWLSLLEPAEPIQDRDAPVSTDSIDEPTERSDDEESSSPDDGSSLPTADPDEPVEDAGDEREQEAPLF